MKKIKLGLLPKIIIAIILGIGFGIVSPDMPVRVFVTFNALFSEFLGFLIPLIIVGLVTPAIADIGKGAGKLLVITALMAYGATVFSGFLSYGVGQAVFPALITDNLQLAQISEAKGIEPFFTVSIPASLNIMTALVMAFTFGLGIAHLESHTLKSMFGEFRDIITKTIQVVVLPLLPIYIFGIFFNMTHSGEVFKVLSVFVKIIGVIFVMHIFLLIFQYFVASLFVRKNPLRLLLNMMPAYFTALGTQSSAATIPVTLRHHPPLGQYDEDCFVCVGADDDAEHSVRLPDDVGLHPHAGHHDGGGAGRTGRSYHGGSRHSLVDARLRRPVARTHDCALHSYGQLRHSLQRHWRRRHCAHRRQAHLLAQTLSQ